MKTNRCLEAKHCSAYTLQYVCTRTNRIRERMYASDSQRCIIQTRMLYVLDHIVKHVRL